MGNLILYVKSRIYLIKQYWYAYIKDDLKGLLSSIYKNFHGRDIDWDKPKEWNEKIIWMQMYADTSIWTKLADKYAVREYLKKKGFHDLLIPLLGVYNDARDINFEKLPDSFVIKTNNGCGDVIIVENKNKSKEQIDRIVKKMNSYLKKPYGKLSGEPHYFKIPPKIVVEKKMAFENNFSSSAVDYKFYCFHGEPVICGVFFNRDPNNHLTMSSFYDMDWQLHKEWVNPNKQLHNTPIPKPHNFDLMKDLCKSLCSEFPFCRLDLYESKGKVYFGEFTFTPAGYSGGSLNPNLFDYLGSLMELQKARIIK